MVKLPNMQGMTIAASTHEKLTALKKEDETYDSVIQRLIQMDQKYNPQPTMMEFEFSTYDISKVFRIVFNGNSHKFEYYGKNKFESSISAWENYPPISKKDKELFIEFKVQEKSFRLLQDMGASMDFDGFRIRRL